jgi:2-keto-4-pentenoate hydratase/2-oxohepta-3-ene-1,7-dioic acid hydratase in catechol pathway
MRLVSYGPFGGERAGFLDGDLIVDLETALRAAGADAPVRDMRLFLEQPTWRALLDRAFAARDAASKIDGKTIRLGCPVPVPRTLIIAGANTKSHIAEAGAVLGETGPRGSPCCLQRRPRACAGPMTTSFCHRKRGSWITRLNWVSSSVVRRDASAKLRSESTLRASIQLAEHEKNPFFRVHYIGKSFDTFCPAGPALVTVDEFAWGKPLKMSTKVNGEIRQQSDTSDLYFGIEELVSYASRSMTLYPGDIIATGSPAGVAFFMKPPRFLQAGDIVRCEIEDVGMIENAVRAESFS